MLVHLDTVDTLYMHSAQSMEGWDCTWLVDSARLLQDSSNQSQTSTDWVLRLLKQLQNVIAAAMKTEYFVCDV